MEAEVAVEAVRQASSIADWVSVVITAVGVTAAVAAVLIARANVISAIVNDRDIAKKANTLEIILRVELTQMHEEAMEIIRRYEADKGKTIGILGVEKTTLKDPERKEADIIYQILNFYEYLSVGVRRNILCEEILRNASFTTIKDIWSGTELFVACVRNRNSNSTAYEAFEELYHRWDKYGYDEPLPPIK